MRKSMLLALAVAVVSAIVAGVLIANMGTETPPGTGNNPPPPEAQGPRNYVVNVTDSIEVKDRN